MCVHVGVEREGVVRLCVRACGGGERGGSEIVCVNLGEGVNYKVSLCCALFSYVV